MPSFDRIRARAVERCGGEAALAARLPVPKTVEALRATGDDRYLSLMSLRVFRAGLKHSLVDAKWPAFETVFAGFAPRAIRAMSTEALEALMDDRRLIRHWGKLKSVQANAAASCALAEEAGSFGAYLADWPGEDIVGLWDDLKRRFQQMGGGSGPMFLRMAGKDSFILSPSIATALGHWGVFEGVPKSKGDCRRVQAAFNEWAAATGLPLSQLSMTLALSVD